MNAYTNSKIRCLTGSAENIHEKGFTINLTSEMGRRRQEGNSFVVRRGVF